jgi:hypothetical protein
MALFGKMDNLDAGSSEGQNQDKEIRATHRVLPAPK